MTEIEIYSAGCPACEEAIELVRDMASDSCSIEVLDMHNTEVARSAKALDIASLPTVVIDGKLARCCQNKGIDRSILEKAGVGKKA